ncbi:MAG: T9SS type A sorting domain-containing protein [Ignavibacteria bacterium]|jgi:hypothetical protein
MDKLNIKYWFLTVILILHFVNAYSQESIDQKLSIYTNSGINGGLFSVDYSIKGTTLSASNTLGSLNADIVYDSSVIKFENASYWNQNLSGINGYEKYINDNDESDLQRSLRIMIAGLNVNIDSTVSQQGFDIGNNYSTVVRLNFIILDNTKFVSLDIKSSTNQIGLFANPKNYPNTFEIHDRYINPPTVIIDESLPVLMSEFNSQIKSDNVSLRWTTTFEQNNNGFKIERKQINLDWNEIGFVKGKGNSNELTQYSFNDNKLSTGKYNYRIKQVDNNGNYKYFNLKNTIEIGLPSKFNLSQNYPNPFNPITKINYELSQDSKVNITVFDILGREITKLVNQEQKAGYYTITADSKNLSSGTYFYRLIAKANGNDYVQTKKMSVIK